MAVRRQFSQRVLIAQRIVCYVNFVHGNGSLISQIQFRDCHSSGDCFGGNISDPIVLVFNIILNKQPITFTTEDLNPIISAYLGLSASAAKTFDIRSGVDSIGLAGIKTEHFSRKRADRDFRSGYAIHSFIRSKGNLGVNLVAFFCKRTSHQEKRCGQSHQRGHKLFHYHFLQLLLIEHRTNPCTAIFRTIQNNQGTVRFSIFGFQAFRMHLPFSKQSMNHLPSWRFAAAH